MVYSQIKIHEMSAHAHLITNVEIHIDSTPQHELVRVVVRDTAIAEWCIKLGLLHEDLITSLIVIDETNRTKMTIMKMGEPEKRGRSVPVHQPARAEIDGCHAVLKAGAQEIHYWLHFCLAAYRDGAAEVDHIDMDAIIDEPQGRNIYVIYHFECFR